MLTLNQLNDIKKRNCLPINRLYCVSCLAEERPGKLYAYINPYTDYATVYTECDEHLAEDRLVYKSLLIVELSVKEIFYLKI